MPKRRPNEKIEKQLKEAPMQRLAGEGLVAHRAFLLWAMQTPTHREFNPVARAVGRAFPTIKDQFKRWRWSERVKSLTADSEAQALYRKLHFGKFGTSEIMMVQKNMVSPVTIFTNTPRSVIEGVEKTLKHSAGDRETVFTKEVKRKHLMLLDAAIGYIAQGIKSGDIRRTLRDLPILIQLRNELNGDASNAKKGSGALVAESMRVADAKKNGGDIVEAMYEDGVELVAILEALRSKGKSGLHGKLDDEEVVNEQ